MDEKVKAAIDSLKITADGLGAAKIMANVKIVENALIAAESKSEDASLALEEITVIAVAAERLRVMLGGKGGRSRGAGGPKTGATESRPAGLDTNGSPGIAVKGAVAQKAVT